MPLDQATIKHLLSIKSEIEEILSDVGDVMPDDFRMTCVLRYCGPDPDIKDMIWTDDVTFDVIDALKRHGDEA